MPPEIRRRHGQRDGSESKTGFVTICVAFGESRPTAERVPKAVNKRRTRHKWDILDPNMDSLLPGSEVLVDGAGEYERQFGQGTRDYSRRSYLVVLAIDRSLLEGRRSDCVSSTISMQIDRVSLFA